MGILALQRGEDVNERLRNAPAGLAGGGSGARGRNLIDGDPVPTKTTRDVPAGTTVTIRTPGGGGYGDPTDCDPDATAADRDDEKLEE